MRTGTLFSELPQMPRIELSTKHILKYLTHVLINKCVLRKSSWYLFLS